MPKVQMQGWPNVEFGIIRGTTCVVCLKHYWTSSRLQTHLRYASRQGHLNRCGAWIREFGIAEAHREDLPDDNLVALPGTTRKDAVALAWPLMLGACASDLEYLEGEFLKEKHLLCTQGISFQLDQQNEEARFAAFHEQCENRWTVAQMHSHWECAVCVVYAHGSP